MEFKFISNKPWVDETIRLRKALRITTLVMAILGIILAIIGIVLLAYMEFVVGVIAIIFGILLPVGYFGANVLLFAKRRKTYSKNAIIEYHFTEDALEIIKLSDDYKTKSVISYGSFSVSKVYNKSRYVVLKTKNDFADIVVIRKKDIVLEDGKQLGQEIVSFVSFLMAKVAEANRAQEVTCEEENSPSNEISGQNDEDTAENTALVESVEDAQNDESDVAFEDLTEKDEVNDIDDEPSDVDTATEVVKYDVVEEDVSLDIEGEDVEGENIVDAHSEIDVDDEPIEEEPCVVEDKSVEDEPVEDDIRDEDTIETRDESLFDYGETIVKNEDLVSNEPKAGFLQDYSSDETIEDK